MTATTRIPASTFDLAAAQTRIDAMDDGFERRSATAILGKLTKQVAKGTKGSQITIDLSINLLEQLFASVEGRQAPILVIA